MRELVQLRGRSEVTGIRSFVAQEGKRNPAWLIDRSQGASRV